MQSEESIPNKPDHKFLIIGTGFSGLGMAVALKQAGETDFVLYERADEVGGTWRDNTYPGCACDVPSHLYSFSFDPNPNWSRLYSGWQEIWQYLIHSSKKFEIRPHIRFGKDVTKVAYDETRCLWTITTQGGETTTARYLVAATGPLIVPVIPKVPGLDAFDGPVMHSGKWDHEVQLEGKRVAVIGTGASSIQIVPSIAPKVKELGLFQRTAPWILPRKDRAMSKLQKAIFKRSTGLQSLFRDSIYWKLEARAVGFLKTPSILKQVQKTALKYIHQEISDPVLREKVTPDYILGCKRILLSDDYYAALARDNVEVYTGGLEKIEGRTLTTKSGETFEADVIALGTGFHGNKPMYGLEVRGPGGRDLQSEWAQTGAEGFYGVCISGYPNLFTLHGPNTGLGHNSVIVMLEAQVEMIMRITGFAKEKAALSVEVKEDAQVDFNRELGEKLEKSIWQQGGCHSWYQLDNGKNVVIWPGFTFDFKRRGNRLPESSFRFGGPTGSPGDA